MLFNAVVSEARSPFEHYPYLYGKAEGHSFYIRAEEELDISRSLIIKSHETYDVYQSLYPKKKSLYIYRDGRDVLLSFYFYTKAFSLKEHTVFERIGKEQVLAARTAKAVHFEAEEFAEFLRKNAAEWASHVKAWLKADDILILKYEDLHYDFSEKLMKIADYLDIEPVVDVAEVKKEYVDEFRRFLSGDNRQFFRKGVIGDWRNYFEQEHFRIFSQLAGELSAKLGYE